MIGICVNHKYRAMEKQYIRTMPVHVKVEVLEELKLFYADLNKQFSAIDCMINQFERIFIDLGYRHLKNMMGVMKLLEVHITDLSIKIPLAAIFRSLTADALTSEYFLALLTKDPEGILLRNETDCLMIEYCQAVNQILCNQKCITRSSYFYNNQKECDKKRSDIHTAKGTPKYLQKGKFLSEATKLELIKDVWKAETKVIVARKNYELNKYFSQYYHYNMAGGNIAQNYDIIEDVLSYEAIIYSLTGFSHSLNVIGKYFSSDLDKRVKKLCDSLSSKISIYD